MGPRFFDRTAQRYGAPLALLFVAIGFLAGEVLARAQWVDTTYFPRPSDVIVELGVSLVRSDPRVGEPNTSSSLGQHALMTLGRWAAAFLSATGLGVGLGLAIGQVRALRAVIWPLVQVLRALPSAALWPICVATLGLKWWSQFLIILFGTVWPVLLNTAAAVTALPKEATDTLEFMRLKPLRRQLTLLRWSAQGVMPGLELACSVAFLLAVTVELFDPNQGGIGWYIHTHSQGSPQPSRQFAALLLVAGLGWALNSVVRRLGVEFSDRRDKGSAVRMWATRVVRVGPRRMRSRALTALLPRRVRSSRFFPILEADYVTGAVEKMFGVQGRDWSLEVLRNCDVPYMLPAECSETSRWLQRDIRIIAHDQGVRRTVLFARSWVWAVDEHVLRDLKGGRKTVGQILQCRFGSSLAFENLAYSEEVSDKLGKAFGESGVIDLVKRVRRIYVPRSSTKILIHEYVPIDEGRAR